MRKESRIYEVYDFDELSEGAKDKAVEKFSDINVDFDWWDSIYDDAHCVGLEITGFDLYRQERDGKLTDSVLGSIQAIKKNHGKKTDTYKLALQYEKLAKKHEADSDDDYDEEFIDEYRQALLHVYFEMFQEEYNYLTSKEAIIETIQANEYGFLKDGKFFTL